MGERPLHTRKVAGSIPAGTTYVVAVRIWYLVLRNKCDVISVLSGSVLPQKLKAPATAGTRCHIHLGHSPTRKVDAMNTMRNIVAAAAVAAMVVTAPAAGLLESGA